MAATDPRVITKKEVLRRLQNYVNNFDTNKEAAEAMGVSPQSLSRMLSDRMPLLPAARDALGLGRDTLYTEKPVPGKYLDGAMADF